MGIWGASPWLAVGVYWEQDAAALPLTVVKRIVYPDFASRVLLVRDPRFRTLGQQFTVGTESRGYLVSDACLV